MPKKTDSTPEGDGAKTADYLVLRPFSNRRFPSRRAGVPGARKGSTVQLTEAEAEHLNRQGGRDPLVRKAP